MSPSNPPVVYQMDAIYRWTLCGGAVLICAVPWVGAIDPVNGYQFLSAMIASAVVAPIALVLIWLSRGSRLELSAQGLSVIKVGFSVRVNWKDIERIGAERSVQGVVLKQPLDTETMQQERWAATRSMRDASNYSPQQLQLYHELRFIDLRGFARQLRTVEFANDMARYAVPVTGSAANGSAAQSECPSC